MSTPPPGWYPDGAGGWRWWDGQRWGAPAPQGPAPGGTDPRTMAMLAHLLAIFTGFIGPLIIYLTSGRDDPFVRHHSAESLNFQITVLIAYIVSFVLILVLVGLLMLMVVGIGALVLEIVGSVAAYRGEWWRYPVNIRFVSGAVGT